jgi:hypothetical protein
MKVLDSTPPSPFPFTEELVDRSSATKALKFFSAHLL